MSRLRTLSLLACGVLLAACASLPPKAAVQLPRLQLAPAALGHELALQQQLHFRFGDNVRDMQALLEVDSGEVRLLVQAFGQTGVRLFWDGKTLRQQRAAWLPPAVRAERVLDDLQFTLWPAQAIRQALPADWTLHEDGARRDLLHKGKPWLSAIRLDARRIRLLNLAEGYQLQIDSIDSADGARAVP